MTKNLARLVAIILSFAGCAGFMSGTPEPTLRVLVYNIHAGKDAAGVDNLERVAQMIRDTRADIVLLQEVDRGTSRSGNVDQVARLSSLTGFNSAFGKTLDYQGGEYGIAILSRWALSGDTLVRLPVVPPQQRAGGRYEPRGALVATVSIPGGFPLHVVNTHLDASRDDAYRIQEIAALGGILKDRSALDGSVVAGGDLNAEPETRVLESIHVAGWRDTWKECGSGAGLTFPANAPIKRIDYLLLPREMTCRRGTVIATETSDHRPVLFELQMRRTP